jgi:hypothetical protein
LALIFGHIPQNPPDRIAVLEVVLGRQLFIEAFPLGFFDEADRDGLEQPWFRRLSGNQTFVEVDRHAPHWSTLWPL